MAAFRERFRTLRQRAGAMTFTNLDLDGSAPVRVRPRVGEWGPAMVLTTAQKKRQRIKIGVFFVLAIVAICLLGWFFYRVLMGY